MTGSVSCNQTDGSCSCKTGVTGLTCDTCADGFYNFSSVGCEVCGCDSVGSVGVSCDPTGQCICRVSFLAKAFSVCDFIASYHR